MHPRGHDEIDQLAMVNVAVQLEMLCAKEPGDGSTGADRAAAGDRIAVAARRLLRV